MQPQKYTTSFLEWSVDSTILLIRFRGVPRPRFDWLLRQFRQVVTNCQWNADKNYWEVPLDDIQIVALFAELNFGKHSMVYVGTRPDPYQMELPLYDD